jgi:photosystem II stability/assembly factor-like uncharacterized protein
MNDKKGFKFMKTIVHCFLLVFIVVIHSNAQWKQINGPFYSTVYSLTASGTNIFAGTSNGVYRSTDHGMSWFQTGLSQYEITGIVFSDSGLIATALYDFFGLPVFFSSDDGRSWTQTFLFGREQVTALAAVGSSCFASTFVSNGTAWGGGYFLDYSTDNSRSWKNVFSYTFARWDDFGPIAFFADSSSSIFIGTKKGIVHFTLRDSLWIPGDTTLPGYSIHSLAKCNGTVFAGSDNGVYRLSQNDTQWTKITAPFSRFEKIIELGKHFALADGKIYSSSNNGADWMLVHDGISSSPLLSIGKSDQTIIAGSFRNGTFLSTNYGSSWSQSGTGLNAVKILSLKSLTGSNQTNVLVAGTGVFLGGGPAGTWYSNCGIMTSTNGGTDWQYDPYYPSDIAVRDFVSAVQPSGEIYFFAGTASGSHGWGGAILLSNDIGMTWDRLNATNLPDINSLVSIRSVLFAGSDTGGVYRSTNNGAIWAAVNNGLTDRSVLCLTAKDTVIFVGTENGNVYQSSDYGSNWTSASSGLTEFSSIYSIAILGSKIYAGTSAGMYLSTNDGTSWIPIKTEIDGHIYTIAAFDKTIIAGTRHHGIIISTNEGIDWSLYNEGLTDISIYKLIADSTFLFAASEDLLWRRSRHVAAVKKLNEVPVRYELMQNYPNPFNSSTKIRYSLPSSANVKLTVYDLLGREIAVLVNEEQSHGWKEVQWNASQCASGLYLIRMQCGSFVDTKKILLMK